MTPTLQQAAQMAQVLDALRDGLSVCMSVTVSRDRKIVRDGCAMYAQTEEWCRWLDSEVAPKISAAIEACQAITALTTALSSQPEPFGWTDCAETDEGAIALYEGPQGDIDGERYRLLRRGQHWSVIDGIGNTLRADDLDAAIDAAMAAKGV